MTEAKGTEMTRTERGLRIYQEQGDQIRRIDRGVYSVPSQNRAGCVYTVDLNAERCDCADRVRYCKHITAATIARARQNRTPRRIVAAAA